MTRRTVKAKDLDPETNVAVGEDEDPAVAPPGGEHFEVWEGYVYNHNRQWPPRKRVRAWLGKETAESYVKGYTGMEADRAALKEEQVSKYYVAVRVEMKRTLL